MRVVNVSSLGHYYGAPEGIRWATLTPGDDSLAARKKLGTAKLYGQSKLVKNTSLQLMPPFTQPALPQGNILFSNELARRYGGEGIVSISLHPGAIKTDLTRHGGELIQRVGRIVTYSVTYGAISSLYAGTTPAAGELNGKVGISTSISVPPRTDLTHNNRSLNSISLAGLGSRFRIRMQLTLNWRRNCGSGVKSKSKMFSSWSDYRTH